MDWVTTIDTKAPEAGSDPGGALRPGQPVREFMGQAGTICGPLENNPDWWVVLWSDGTIGCADRRSLAAIDTKAACPISTPPDPGPMPGLRLAGREPPEDDEPEYVDPCYADPAEVGRTIAAQLAELRRLRARVAELEAEVAELERREDARPRPD